MLERFNKVDNPLTIIAIFAGITEVAAAIALPLLQESTQLIFVWFLILFPFALVMAFFITLNFNTRVLYAPADYRDDEHFMAALRLSEKTVQLSVTSPDDAPPMIEKITRDNESPDATSPFDGVSKDELNTVNDAIKHFGEKAKKLFKSDLIDGYSFGISGEGLFLLNVVLKNREVPGPPVESRIIRATSLQNGSIELSIIGHGIRCSAPEDFAEALCRDLESSIRNRKKQCIKK